MPDPEPAEPAAVVETHISTLFFVGGRAYKLKKPVRTDFVDFSTREARRQACHREVELNRRLAPDVYLGVADVTGPDGELCDHLVVMRRMPSDRRLATLAAAGAPLRTDVAALARTIAPFHATAARADPAWRAVTRSGRCGRATSSPWSRTSGRSCPRPTSPRRWR